MEETPKTTKKTTRKKTQKKKMVKLEMSPAMVSEAPKEEMITFKTFFYRALNLKKVLSHQERELEVFCQEKKLRSKETFETFLKMIEQY